MKKIIFIAQSAMIAAIYVVLCYVFRPISFGPIQARVAEALTILPVFTPAAIPGVTIGCLLANILSGCALPDIIFGSIATLIGAVFTYLLRRNQTLALLPPIISNMLIVPFILKYAYAEALPIYVLIATVGIGEIISVGILGKILLVALKKYSYIFHIESAK